MAFMYENREALVNYYAKPPKPVRLKMSTARRGDIFAQSERKAAALDAFNQQQALKRNRLKVKHDLKIKREKIEKLEAKAK